MGFEGVFDSRRTEVGWLSCLLDSQHETNDKTVQSQSLSENEDENHTSEEERLLSVGADTSVTDNTNGHTGSQTSQTDGETRSEMGETSVGVVFVDDNCNEKRKGQKMALYQGFCRGAHTDTRNGRTRQCSYSWRRSR